MAGINGMGTTFNLPNFNGVLYGLTPEDTPFVSAIGALSGGGEPVYAKEFEWQTYDLRAPVNPSHLEGALAPQANNRVRQNLNNITQIFHSTLSVSYTKLAATAMRSGLAHNQGGADGTPANEMQWQIEQELKAIKRDLEVTFLSGTYQKDTNDTTARKTRGVLSAITTNVVVAPDDDGAGAGTTGALTEKMVLDLMQSVWTNGGIQEAETATLMTNAAQKRRLTKIFITDKGYTEETRNVGGVRCQTIETDFGRLNIMLNRHFPSNQLGVISLEACKPRIMMIPGKGFLFLEPLAKVGASDQAQLYGEIGLEYGNELQHGKITNLTL